MTLLLLVMSVEYRAEAIALNLEVDRGIRVVTQMRRAVANAVEYHQAWIATSPLEVRSELL